MTDDDVNMYGDETGEAGKDANGGAGECGHGTSDGVDMDTETTADDTGASAHANMEVTEGTHGSDSGGRRRILLDADDDDDEDMLPTPSMNRQLWHRNIDDDTACITRLCDRVGRRLQYSMTSLVDCLSPDPDVCVPFFLTMYCKIKQV